jgi:ribose transport system permease protein
MSTTKHRDPVFEKRPAASEMALSPAQPPQSGSPARSHHPFLRKLSFANIGAVYVLLAIVVIASIWLPEVFPTLATVKQILNNNAVTALAALAILIPLCAGVFDLSFAYVMSLSGVTTAYAITSGAPIALAIAAGIAAGLLVGVINGFVVVGLGIDSFIGTLATGSLVQALISLVTDDKSIVGAQLSEGFAHIGQSRLLGLTLPVLYAAVVAIVLWFVLTQTTAGRRLYGIGFNRDAARLAGVATERLRFGSLIASSGLAAFAGIVLCSVLGTGSPTAGTTYLLAAFAAAFLGATQFHSGRFNVPGTIVAILLLGTGQTALSLAASPSWTANAFTGVVLIVALAAARSSASTPVSELLGRWRARLRPRASHG